MQAESKGRVWHVVDNLNLMMAKIPKLTAVFTPIVAHSRIIQGHPRRS
jgi:hypothetical protein